MHRICLVALAIFLATGSLASATAKDLNISVSPLAFLNGVINARLDFKIGPSWTIGPEAAVFNARWTDVEVTGLGVGVRANMYFSGQVFEDGWYFGPGAVVSKVKASTTSLSTGNKLTVEVTSGNVSAIVGYHWFWDTFNMSLGGGAALSTVGDTLTLKNKSTGEEERLTVKSGGTGFAAEWNIGWTF